MMKSGLKQALAAARLGVLALLALSLAAGCPAVDLRSMDRRSAGLAATPKEPEALVVTGILEMPVTVVSSETGGRLTKLMVDEGDEVEAGQLLALLDDSALHARIAQADAAIAEAQAQLDLLLAGVRQEETAHARALVAQAQLGVEVAQGSLEDARWLRDNPQALDLEIIEAETTVAKARHQATAARFKAEATDLEVALWGRITELLSQGIDVPLPGGGSLHVDKPAERAESNTQWNLAGQQAWQDWQAAYAAEEAVTASDTALADLRRRRETPLAADARVNQAEAAVRQALVAVEKAEAGLALLEEGARREEIEVAQRAVDQAQAAREALDVLMEKTRLVAPPRSGLVSALHVREGEATLPGTPLLEILDRHEAILVVFIPTPDLGRVHLGQEVQVTTDSFPERIFTGSVTHIADQAEFTPKNVQTRQDRVHNVFAVEITLPNPDGALKAGMPADASFVASDTRQATSVETVQPQGNSAP